MRCPECNSDRAIGSGSATEKEIRNGLHCPDCGYMYDDIQQINKDNFIAQEQYAYGSIKSQEVFTLRIDHCEHIYLTQKGIDVEVDLHMQYFDKIEEIMINGRRFIKEDSDERIST